MESVMSKQHSFKLLQPQGKPRLAVRQPRDEALPGLDPRQLLMLMTEVYGLVSGPSWWRRTFVKLATETLGYHLNVYDKCCVVLSGNDKSEGALSQGFVVLTVDGIAEGGSELHTQKMKQLEGLLTFGKISELMMTPKGSTYAGRHLRQMPDFSFQSHMDEFVYTRLEPIKLGCRVLKKDAEKIQLNETEKTQLRGLVASLNWVAREGRPDASVVVWRRLFQTSGCPSRKRHCGSRQDMPNWALHPRHQGACPSARADFRECI